MTDVFSKEKRSSIMSNVSDRDTKPEIIVRKILHSMGFRYRLHVKGLPGRPDIVMPKYKKIIFIHGCFWHGHCNCKRSKRPATNIEFWNKKIDSNIKRDKKAIDELRKLGWDVLVIWQCQTVDKIHLQEILRDFTEKKDTSLDQLPPS